MLEEENCLNNVKEIKQVTPQELAETFQEYFAVKHQLLNEVVQSTRYAVDINFRTTMDEVKYGFAKIAIGYVSAALKNLGFHVKLVFTEPPLRVLVSSRNWDDNEWVGMISYNKALGAFVLSKGYYNKSKKSVTVMKSTKIDEPINASTMSEKLKKTMDSLKDEPERKAVKIDLDLKRGPKS